MQLKCLDRALKEKWSQYNERWCTIVENASVLSYTGVQSWMKSFFKREIRMLSEKCEKIVSSDGQYLDLSNFSSISHSKKSRAQLYCQFAVWFLLATSIHFAEGLQYCNSSCEAIDSRRVDFCIVWDSSKMVIIKNYIEA